MFAEMPDSTGRVECPERIEHPRSGQGREGPESAQTPLLGPSTNEEDCPPIRSFPDRSPNGSVECGERTFAPDFCPVISVRAK